MSLLHEINNDNLKCNDDIPSKIQLHRYNYLALESCHYNEIAHIYIPRTKTLML